ncbi:hypothetical protein L1887_20830 [Cichorium endivia]|nr:hypothetical protein L1887_20830 [Cichorium endivia]
MEKDEGCCYFHPDEVFVGVCPLCLYERLVVVATKRCRRLRLYRSSSCKSSKPRIILPKMFAIDSLIHRKTKKHLHNHDASPTHDDSFISIRFDDNNGVGAWEKEKLDYTNNQKSLVEHAKPQWPSMRWRKRIGHVFQLITWKKSNRHVVKGNQWIRNITRRKIND